MKTGVVLGVTGLAAMTVALGQLSAGSRDDAPVTLTGAVATGGETDGAIGPDVIVGDLTGPRYWTQDATEAAYSIGTTSCNLGDEPLEWIDELGSNHHPVIGQNLFKITGDGRFLHIGQSWLKHGFCALQGTICGACDEYCGGCCDHLGPGCSDPYTASRNGTQSGLGPKWQVNPHTGVFPIPWDQGEGTSGEFRRRLRVKIADLDTSLDEGAQFVMEGQYVTQDDAVAGNQNNNASYRRVAINQSGTYSASFIGSTVRQQTAMEAWATLVPGVQLADVQVPGDGLVIVGSYVHMEGSEYVYEYAVHNLNVDRGISSFVVPVPEGVVVTEMGFRDVDYHSGEVWDNTDWNVDRNISDVTWSNGVKTYEGNELANAIRWGTTYSFWFTSPEAPAKAEATFGLFKPGKPDVLGVSVQAPEAACVPSLGDVNDDTFVDVYDLLAVLGEWGCTGTCPADTTCDGVVSVDDLLDVLEHWSS